MFSLMAPVSIVFFNDKNLSHLKMPTVGDTANTMVYLKSSEVTQNKTIFLFYRFTSSDIFVNTEFVIHA